MADHPLEGIFKDLSDLSDGDDPIKLRDLISTLEERGFGPLLLVLAGFMLLPVGMVPGFPALIGLLFVICGAQMLRGVNGVWLPDRLAGIDIPADKFCASLSKAWPMVRRARKALGGRLKWAVTGLAVRIIAAVLLALGVTMIALGFIPGLPFVLALPVLLFGLGLTAGDGLVALAGFALLGPAVWAGMAGL